NQGIHRRHHVGMVISHSAAARHDAIIDFFQKLVPISQQEVGINLLARDVLPSVVATRVFLAGISTMCLPQLGEGVKGYTSHEVEVVRDFDIRFYVSYQLVAA